MVQILLHGACGRMGRMIADIASEYPDVKIAAGVDAFGTAYADFPVYKSLSEVQEECSVIVDFSTAAAMDDLFAYAETKTIPAVVCTTCLSEEQMDKLKKLSEKTAVLKSANMSLGVNLLQSVLEEVSGKLLAAGFDCDIVEMHHRKKIDAPSGTALALADSVKKGADKDLSYVFDRSERRMQRPADEIGISAVRGGTIVGDHEVIFAGADEVITFRHEAFSRAVFAKGAVEAARFLAGKGPGYYGMRDVLA